MFIFLVRVPYILDGSVYYAYNKYLVLKMSRRMEKRVGLRKNVIYTQIYCIRDKFIFNKGA